jgi:hypothetical protein
MPSSLGFPPVVICRGTSPSQAWSTRRHKGVRVTINTRVISVRRDGNALVAALGSDFAKGWREEWW